MKVLLVTATRMEVQLLLNECSYLGAPSDVMKTYSFQNVTFDLLVTGLGTTFTTYHLTNALSISKYRLAVNLGLAGSLSEDFRVGDVVNVVDEEFADLGIEEDSGFLTLFDSGFMQSDEFPFENRVLKADKLLYATHLPRVKGITSNISHGKKSSISEIKSRFTAQVESMEGAAFFYVCRWMGVPCMQIRAISNHVAPRDDAQWDIPLALDNLKNSMMQLLAEIS